MANTNTKIETSSIKHLVFKKNDGTFGFYDEVGLPHTGCAYTTFEAALNGLRAYLLSLNAVKHETKL